jgi:hypothetical protein
LDAPLVDAADFFWLTCAAAAGEGREPEELRELREGRDLRAERVGVPRGGAAFGDGSSRYGVSWVCRDKTAKKVVV